MDNPTKKRWWTSKTILSGIGTIIVGIISVATGDVATGISAIVTGAGAIFGRSVATQEIEKPKPSN